MVAGQFDRPTVAPIDVGHLARYERPQPVMSGYDQLLNHTGISFPSGPTATPAPRRFRGALHPEHPPPAGAYSKYIDPRRGRSPHPSQTPAPSFSPETSGACLLIVNASDQLGGASPSLWPRRFRSRLATSRTHSKRIFSFAT
jgi:hypothetical protein